MRIVEAALWGVILGSALILGACVGALTHPVPVAQVRIVHLAPRPGVCIVDQPCVLHIPASAWRRS